MHRRDFIFALRPLVLPIGILGTGCHRKLSPPGLQYRIPLTFQGYVHIQFSVLDAPPLPLQNGKYIIDVPDSGIVQTSTPLPAALSLQRLQDPHAKKPGLTDWVAVQFRQTDPQLQEFLFKNNGTLTPAPVGHSQITPVNDSLLHYAESTPFYRDKPIYEGEPTADAWRATNLQHIHSQQFLFVGDPDIHKAYAETLRSLAIAPKPRTNPRFSQWRDIRKKDTYWSLRDISASRLIVHVDKWTIVSERAIDADLSGSQTKSGRFERLCLVRSGLRHCEFQHMTWKSVYLFGCDLTGTRFDDVTFRNCIYDEKTIWPTGFHPDKAGWIPLSHFHNLALFSQQFSRLSALT